MGSSRIGAFLSVGMVVMAFALMSIPTMKSSAGEVAPVHGEEMQKIVERIMGTPKELAARAKHLVE